MVMVKNRFAQTLYRRRLAAARHLMALATGKRPTFAAGPQSASHRQIVEDQRHNYGPRRLRQQDRKPSERGTRAAGKVYKHTENYHGV